MPILLGWAKIPPPRILPAPPDTGKKIVPALVLLAIAVLQLFEGKLALGTAGVIASALVVYRRHARGR